MSGTGVSGKVVSREGACVQILLLLQLLLVFQLLLLSLKVPRGSVFALHH